MKASQPIDKLRLSRYKLKVLLDITTSITENKSANFLLKHFVYVLSNELEIKNIVIFIKDDDKWRFAPQSTIKRTDIKISVKKDLLKYKQITPILSDKKLKDFDFVIPVRHKKLQLAYFLISDNNDDFGNSNTIKHLNFIKTLANIIIVSIENKRLFKKAIGQEVLKNQMKLAADIQKKLIPDKKLFPNNKFIKINTYYKPHFDIGGDYYDIIKLSNHEYGFCIADVSGKGISAALLMSNFQATLKALYTSKISLRNLLIKLNKYVFDLNKGDRFITIFIAKYNVKTKILTYINAAHTTPILFNKKTSEYHLLTSGTVGLGMLKKIPKISVKTIELHEPTRLICYTDGLSELENEKQQTFEISEIIKVLNKNYHIQDFIPKLNKSIQQFKGKNDFFDDISIMCLDFCG